MTRIAPKRNNTPRHALQVLALLFAGCTPAPRLIAVSAADGRVVMYDATLNPVDTIQLDRSPALGVPVDLLFGGDGTGLLATLVSDSGTTLVQVRRTGGTALRRRRLDDERTTDVLPLRGGSTLLTIGTATGDGAAGGGVVSIVSLSPHIARARLDVCGAVPVGAAVRADGDEAFVACDDDTIAEVDPQLRRVVRQIPLEGEDRADRKCGAGGMAFSPSETVLLILCASSGRLLYLDRVTLAPFDSVDVGGGGKGLVVSRPLGIAIVGYGAAGLALVDLARRQLRIRIPLSGRPVSLALSADGRSVYAVMVEHTQVERGPVGRSLKIDLRSGRVAIQAPAPPNPTAIAVWPGEEAPIMSWFVGQSEPAPNE